MYVVSAFRFPQSSAIVSLTRFRLLLDDNNDYRLYARSSSLYYCLPTITTTAHNGRRTTCRCDTVVGGDRPKGARRDRRVTMDGAGWKIRDRGGGAGPGGRDQ